MMFLLTRMKHNNKATKMKAVICTKYGSPDVLKITEVEKPLPKDHEVCIKIHASAVTASDIFVRSSILPLRYKIPMRLLLGIKKPRKPVIGLVLAGEIESIGKDITLYEPGDKVYGITGFGFGAYAEYKCMKESDSTYGCFAKMPDNYSYEEATVAAYGGLLAAQYLEKGNIDKVKKVLIYGASGTTGTMAVQIAKYLGAEVTGVCSTKNMELVKSLGADQVLDYTKETELPEHLTFDLILDAVGKMKSSPLKKSCKKALTKNGKYISIDDGDLKLSTDRLLRIKDYVEKGNFKAVIDKTYALDEIREAHRYVEKGHKVGGVVIKITDVV